MKILYFHQFFNTPRDGGSTRSYYLAKSLVDAGHHVEFITTDVHGLKRKENIEGVSVTYLPVKFNNAYGFRARIVAYLKYAWLACIESRKHDHVDLCYIMTTPLTTGLTALFNRYILKRPYAVEVGDLWPLVPIEMGVFKNRWVKKMLYAFEKKFYKSAKGLIGLSPPISKYIQNIAPDVPIETVYNMADCDSFTPHEKHHHPFVITYAGNFGIANDLERMIPIIEKSQHLPIHFKFIGNGAEKIKVEQKASQLKNCSFLGHLDKQQVAQELKSSDAMLISFANYPSLSTGCPNKLFDAMAAGLVVITNFNGWVKNLIEEERIGFSFQHDSTEDFIKKLAPFLGPDNLADQYKQKSRLLAESRFTIYQQASIQRNFLESLKM